MQKNKTNCVTTKGMKNWKYFMTLLKEQFSVEMLKKSNLRWTWRPWTPAAAPADAEEAALDTGRDIFTFFFSCTSLPSPPCTSPQSPPPPPTPCSNQANLAPLPSSLTSSPAYTTLQSPDFKRNLKFRSSEIFPSQNINIPRYHILASSEWSVKFQSESLRLPLSLKMSRRL